MKVLIIEDDRDIVDTINLSFQIGWPGVELVSTHEGKKGIDMVVSETPDVTILDLGLPDISGFEVLRQIRSFSDVPIIILTVMADEDNVVKGLEWGADDYVTKPFKKMELLARVKNIMRRQQSPDESVPLVCGSLHYDPSKYKFFYHEKEISLTATESAILCHLMKKADHVISHSSLAETVWGTDYPGATDALKVHIRHLREKLETDPSHPRLILTSPGIGYSLVKPD